MFILAFRNPLLGPIYQPSYGCKNHNIKRLKSLTSATQKHKGPRSRPGQPPHTSTCLRSKLFSMPCTRKSLGLLGCYYSPNRILTYSPLPPFRLLPRLFLSGRTPPRPGVLQNTQNRLFCLSQQFALCE